MKKRKILQNALRYAGQPGTADPDLSERLDRLYDLACKAACFRMEYRIIPVRSDQTAHRIVLGDQKKQLELPGQLAWRMLESCQEALILGATLGIGFDRELQRLQQLNMADALLFDAIGSAMIEEELDLWQSGFSSTQTQYLSDRFSCGYGDLPLSLQSTLADCLDLARTAGIFVQPSQMMIPTKSVTALIGLSDVPQPARIRGCASCALAHNCSCSKLKKTADGCGAMGPLSGNDHESQRNEK